MSQIIEAVQLVHSKDYVHRDLKPENILVGQDGNIKLADFGLAAHFKLNKNIEERAGTFLYMAPEQATQGKIYGKKIDMWALGIIMYKILSCGKHPLSNGHIDKEQFIKKLINPKFQFDKRFSSYAKDFFLKLCDKAPMNRYTASQAL